MRSVLIVLALVVALTSLATASELPSGETRAQVAELAALHDVIYPLWHTAWPAKDTAMMAELLPEAQRGVEAVEKAELPGILRDKQVAWNEGVAALRAAVDAYAAGVAATDAAATLAAVEDFHARFEQLVRVIRPPMKELDAFHVVLYDLWHHFVPDGQTEKLPASAAELVSRCDELATATLPRRTEGREESFRVAIAELCTSSRDFRAAVEQADPAAVQSSIATVHDRYQALEKLFEEL
jgi:hypothetical protein